MKKIALVYDRVNTPYGGAEQVLLALHQLYPKADLFTSLYHPRKAKWAQVFNVKSSFLQKIPLIKSMHRFLAVLMPLAFESLDLSEYDIVISITSAEAKGVITRKDQLHVSYLLTPPRYLYHYQEGYLKSNKIFKLPLIKSLAKKSLNYLKNWDQLAIHRPDFIIPISEIVAKRAKDFYQIDCPKIIYPPVDSKTSLDFNLETGEITPEYNQNNYYLLVSRLVAYKNIDVAIKAAAKIGRKLVIVGEGPQERKLKNLAKKLEKKAGYKREELIIFKKKLHPRILAKTYLNSIALLMPGIDDFGIAALEANLYGKPVIINQISGAAELIEHKKHGILLKYHPKDSNLTLENNLIKAIKELEKSKFKPQIMVKNALKYDTNSFVLNFEKTIDELYLKKVKGKL